MPPTDEYELLIRKLSIRSINVNQHMLHLSSPFNPTTAATGANTRTTILSRASNLLMKLKREETGGDDDQANFLEEEEYDDSTSPDDQPHSRHRCSMIKSYHMPTFFMTEMK
jgi:hypothetical protein